MFNFIRFAQEHRVPFLSSGHHHCHAGWLQTHCPQCTDGKHGYHLGYSLQKGNLNCWRCGSIRRDSYISAILGVSRHQAIAILREFDDGHAGRGQPPEKRVRKRSIDPPLGAGPLKAAHRRYLLERGFDPKELRDTWELKGVGPLGGVWAWRVVFPIKNARGDIVAWGGRAISNEVKRKYLLTPDENCLEDPRSFLYGIHKAAGKSVIVVEGPADVWNVGECSVGTLGVDWRQEQVLQLVSFQNRYIAYDPEPLAQKRARRLAEHLSMFPGTTELITGLSSDPGSLPKTTIRKIRKKLLGRYA